MDIFTEISDDIIYVTVDSVTIDASRSDAFHVLIAALVKPKVKIVINLERVEFIDSSACRTIFALLRQLTEAGGDLKLCSVAQPVQSLLKLTRIHRTLEIIDHGAEPCYSME
jgi:anti-sigma B factor antagonist